MSLPEIWLTWVASDLAVADRVGHERCRQAMANGRMQSIPGPIESDAALHNDLLGARAELAAKFYLDPIIWHDLAPNLENLCDLEIGNLQIDVKGIEKKEDDCLIVQAGKPPTWAYFLVYAKNKMEYRILGWLWGHEAQRRGFWRHDVKKPAYFVPQGVLQPAATLLDEVRKRRFTAVST
jgi:hypothetical protein